jgi:hypothetical protein
MSDQVASSAAFSLPPSGWEIQGVAVRHGSNTRRFAFSKSTIEIDNGLWRMTVREADSYSGGLAIGKLLSIAQYPAVAVFRRRFVSAVFALLYRFAHQHFAQIRIPERYLDELRGYADGTGIPYRTLFCMNFIFDVLKKYGFHCSSVAIAESGSMLIGRNTDLIPWIGRLALKFLPSIVLEMASPGKLRYVHVTPGLFLGVFNGYNECGTAVLSHQVAATNEKPVPFSLATVLLQRMLLEEAGDMACAEAIIRANPVQRCISNMVVSAKEALACIFEISPTTFKKLTGTAKYLCCATHFQDEAFSTLHPRSTAESERRLKLMNLLARKAKATPDDIIKLLKNYDNGLTHRNSGRSPTNKGTYQSLVFDIALHRIFVADGRTLPVSLSGAYREVVVDV